MNDNDKRRALARYDDRLSRYGDSPLTLGWGVKGRANLRFEILLSQWDFRGSSVIDFGCGFGDLLGYAETRKIDFLDYLGIDINGNLLKIAKQKYPGGRFIETNILDEKIELNSDYLLSSGVFNHKVEDNYQFVNDAFIHFDRFAKKGFAVNFISNRIDAPEPDDEIFYFAPERILEISYKYSNNIVMRNDYMPFEFTVFINKQSNVNKEFTVYEEFVPFV